MADTGPPDGTRRQSHSVERGGILGRPFSLIQLSKWLAPWEALVAASILPSITLVIFQAAFDAGIVWQWAVVYVLDAVYVASMLVRFLSGYMKRGVLITERKKVVLNYLKRSFFVDLLSVLPLEILAFAVLGSESRGEKLALAAFLRLNRCIRCYRVWTFINAKENELGTNTSLLTTLKFSYLAVLSMHIISCCWFAISCQNQATFDSRGGTNTLCKADSWAQYPSISWEGSSVYKRYIVSLYWTVTTITSVGYGDILPTSSAEKWVSVVFMLWGVVLFGYILGGLASTLTTSDAQRARYIHRLNVIRDHLDDAGVSSKIKKKVINFYEYLWQRNKGNPGTELFDDLPVAFQAELSLETYKNIIKKSTLFQDAPEEFMRMLSLVAEQQLYLPSQVIISKGDIGQHMYIITRGQAEVISGDGEVVAVLREGSLFGEINLVYDVPCGGTVRAKTHCDILLLSKSNVYKILQHFPEMSTKMKGEIQRRCNEAFASSASGLGGDVPRGDDSEEEEGDILISLQTPSSTAPSSSSLLQKLRQWWDSRLVMPGTKFSVVWDLLLASVVIAICLVYSYEAGFSLFRRGISYGAGVGGSSLFAITYLLDFVLVVDIVISMKTAVRTPTGMITKSRVILKHYLCSRYFLLDVAAVLPLELYGLAWDAEERYGYIAVLRLNRLIKIWKVMSFFNQMEHSLYISVAYARALKFLFYILTVTHISACIWFPLACSSQGNCSGSSWAAAHGITANSTSPMQDYIISLYWASATLTSVGYGDISAHNAREMVFALVVQLIGIILYGYCLGVIAATLTNAASFRISFEEKMQVVHQFMFENKLGTGLLQRVDHYFSLLWQQFRGETVPGGEDLLHDMPTAVREDVSMEEYASLLSRAHFFQHVDASFLRRLSTATSTFLFAPGDIVLYSGDMGREMYFIARGYVEVLCDDLSQVVAVQGPGGYFGELGFLFGSPRTLTIRAATNCKLVMLENRDLQNILPEFPLLAKEFESLYKDKEHVTLAHNSAQEVSRRAMAQPRRFAKPCVLSALATAMIPSLSVAIRAPMANTIAACVGSKDVQSMVACPHTIGKRVTGSLLKFNRKEMQEALRSDAETGGGGGGGGEGKGRGVRQRRNVQQVRPSPSDVAAKRGGEEEVEDTGSSRAYQSTLDNIASYCLLPYTFNPNTRGGQVWELVGVIMALVSVFCVSIQAAFLHSEPWLWAINYTADLYFIADMMVKLHTIYHNEEGVLITQPIKCAKHYFKTNFFLDLLSSIPTDILVLVSWTRDIRDVMRILSMSRLNRILRIYKLPLAFKYLESQVGRPVGTITEVRLALYMALTTHLMACGWFILACSSMSAEAGDPHTCGRDSWAMQMHMLDGSNNHLSNYSISYQYLVSVYWATATSTTVGYGDISAFNDIERVYAVLVMMLGVLAYGYIIASVTASLANADSARAQYQEKLEGIKSFMDDQNLDSALQTRVINYYEYNWQRNKGVNFGSLFQGMPISLQADISLSLYKGIIDQVPLFQNTEIGFTKLLALSIEPQLFLSKEYIVKKGDIGSEMFFINRGTVEVVSEDGSVVFATMTEGKFFGEISLVFSCPRTASIRAATNCDVFVLTKANLDRALNYYPEIAEQIREVAGNRANLVKKRSQIAAKAAAEGKSAADAAKAAAQGTKDETEEEKPAPAVATPSQQQPQQPPAAASQGKKEGESSQKKDQGAEAVVEVEQLEIEEPGEPPRPPVLSRALAWLRDEVWPKTRWLFIFTIERDGRVGIFLRVFGTLMAFLSCFTITYQAAFQNNTAPLWAANYVFELYFLIELYLKFHLTYKDSNGQTVRDNKAIVLHYVKDPLGFALDLLAVLPFEILASPVPDMHTRTAAMLYLRIPHVIRGVRIQSFISEEEKRLNQKTLLLRLVKFTVLISVCTHFVACVWYVLGCQAKTCHPNTWASTADLVDTTASDADHYLNSLYWAMATMTTTGYGDLSATNAREMVYGIAVMVVGKLLFGFILGSIASTLANLDTQRVLFEEKLSALKGYMKEKNLSSVMQGRVLSFFDYLWVRNKAMDPQLLLGDMPYCMQSEVFLATTESLIRKVPLFASVSDAFLRHLTLKIRPCMFLPREFIVHKGDVGLGMFFLYHGTAEVLDDDSGRLMLVTEVLGEGGHFGVESLISNSPMRSSVIAVTHVDVFSISQRDFESVLQVHPNSQASIAEQAEQQYGLHMTTTST